MFFNRRTVLPALSILIVAAALTGCHKKDESTDTVISDAALQPKPVTGASGAQTVAQTAPSGQRGGEIDSALQTPGVSTLKALLNAEPGLVNQKDANGATPLMKAVALNRADMASFLIDRGASINVRRPAGDTVLDQARSSNRAEIVKLLRKHGAKSGL